MFVSVNPENHGVKFASFKTLCSIIVIQCTYAAEVCQEIQKCLSLEKKVVKLTFHATQIHYLTNQVYIIRL